MRLKSRRQIVSLKRVGKGFGFEILGNLNRDLWKLILGLWKRVRERKLRTWASRLIEEEQRR